MSAAFRPFGAVSLPQGWPAASAIDDDEDPYVSCRPSVPASSGIVDRT